MVMENTTPHQDIGYQVVQVMAKRIRPDMPRPIVLGGLPVGAVILGGVTQTVTPFEGGGNYRVGTRDKPDAYGSFSFNAKGRGAFADKGEIVTTPLELLISSPEDEKAETPAPAPKEEKEAKAESAADKEARNRAARAAEAKARKEKAETEEEAEAKPRKGDAVVYLTFIVVP